MKIAVMPNFLRNHIRRKQSAKAELQARAGSQFDHDVVEAFLSLNGELGPDAGTEDEASAHAAEV